MMLKFIKHLKIIIQFKLLYLWLIKVYLIFFYCSFE